MYHYIKFGIFAIYFFTVVAIIIIVYFFVKNKIKQQKESKNKDQQEKQDLENKKKQEIKEAKKKRFERFFSIKQRYSLKAKDGITFYKMEKMNEVQSVDFYVSVLEYVKKEKLEHHSYSMTKEEAFYIYERCSLCTEEMVDIQSARFSEYYTKQTTQGIDNRNKKIFAKNQEYKQMKEEAKEHYYDMKFYADKLLEQNKILKSIIEKQKQSGKKEGIIITEDFLEDIQTMSKDYDLRVNFPTYFHFQFSDKSKSIFKLAKKHLEEGISVTKEELKVLKTSAKQYGIIKKEISDFRKQTQENPTKKV